MYNSYIEDADELLTLPSALPAEVWVSTQLGGIHRAASLDFERHEAILCDLIQAMRSAATPPSYAFLRIYAAVGHAALRAEARRAAATVGRNRFERPSWLADVGDVRPHGAWLVGGFAQQVGDAVLIECRYRTDTDGHGLLVLLVDEPSGPVPVEIMVLSSASRMLDATRSDPTKTLEPITLEDAGARLRSAFANAGETGLPVSAESQLFEHLALAFHRIELLP